MRLHGKLSTLGIIAIVLGVVVETQGTFQTRAEDVLKRTPAEVVQDPPEPKEETTGDRKLQNAHVQSDVFSQESHEGLEEGKGLKRLRRAIEKDPLRRWTKGIVPYVFKMSDRKTLTGIRIPMNKIMYYTCIRFVPYEGPQTKEKYGLDHDGFLKFLKGKCSAAQGNKRKKGGQNIKCCGMRACLHELGHSLGLPHEHMNELRDDYIRIEWENLKESDTKKFVKNMPGRYSMADPIDPSSVMSYGALNDETKIQTSLEGNVDYMYNFNLFYYFKNIVEGHDCKGLYCSNFTMTCANDGFVSVVNGKCACLCPPGLDPSTGCTSVIKNPKPAAAEWPRGEYGLLQTTDGCPGKPGEFQTGSVEQLSQRGNKVSNNSVLGGIQSSKVKLHFCMMDNRQPPSASSGNWSTGRYCLFRYGGRCPEGFEPAYVQFDDNGSSGNSQTGAYPDGVYGRNTRYEFCCRQDNFDDVPLSIPNTGNFALFLIKLRQECPAVEGMYATREFYTFNNAREQGVKAGVFGEVKPFIQFRNNRHKVFFCYYRPKFTDCGGYYDLTDSNREVTISSPNFPSPYPAGAECHYFIKGPEDSTLVMTFGDHQLDSYCEDQLVMRFHNPGEAAESLCGRIEKIKGNFHSVRNFISMDFLSGHQTNGKRFQARVRMIRDSELCYSKKDKGASYRGTKSYTRTLKPCVPWSEVSHCRMSLFEFNDRDHGLEENYCRNPGFGLRPWCYVNAKTCERAYCDVCNLMEPWDTKKDCEEKKASGECRRNPELALTDCARTCKSHLPPESPPPPSVSQVKCKKPPSVPHASILESPKASYAVGDKVTYKCQDGYETVSSSCLTTGAWSPVNYVCGGCPEGWFYSQGYCYGYQAMKKRTKKAMKECAKYPRGVLSPARTKEEIAALDNARNMMNEFRPILVSPRTTTGLGSRDVPPSSRQKLCAVLTGLREVRKIRCRYGSTFVCRTPLRVSASTVICVDRRADCERLSEKHPGFCRDKKDFAMVNCRKTCSLCDDVTKLGRPDISVLWRRAALGRLED